MAQSDRLLLFLLGAGVLVVAFWQREKVASIVDRVIATTTRGFRNNNPLNIERGQGFVGEIPSDNETRFAVFSAPEYGYRAATKILDNYKRLHGIGTVQGIIARWAPGHENPTDAYISYVAGKVGVAPSAALNLSDEKTMIALLDAMTRFENNRLNPFGEVIILSGIRLARG